IGSIDDRDAGVDEAKPLGNAEDFLRPVRLVQHGSGVADRAGTVLGRGIEGDVDEKAAAAVLGGGAALRELGRGGSLGESFEGVRREEAWVSLLELRDGG